MENSGPDYSDEGEASERELGEESKQFVVETSGDKDQNERGEDCNCVHQTQNLNDVKTPDENREQVLVEKDGKFELVNVSEVSAHWSSELLSGVETDVNTVDGAIAENGDGKAENEIHVESTGIRETKEVNEVDVHPSEEEIRRVLDEVKEQNGNSHMHPDTEETGRSQSSIGYTNTSVDLFETNRGEEKLKRPRNQQQTNETARRQQAQEAFKDWLCAKKEQKQKAKLLAAKLAAERQQGFSWNAGSQASREDCDARFEEWLEEKKKQRRRELRLQTRQQQLLEEETVKPSEQEIKTAYKRWLKGKQKQEFAAKRRTEAVQEQQKLEARRIKQSLDMRFSMA